MNQRLVGFLLASALVASSGCHAPGPTEKPRTVSLRMKGNVPDAEVTIDDERIGPLGYVAVRGVALPPGRHRITVEKAGYFPWDSMVEAAQSPIFLEVRLTPIPD